MTDNKIVQVALVGLANVLEAGKVDKVAAGPGATNQYATYVGEAGGVITICNLRSHDNSDIYRKAYNIMDKCFPDDEEVNAGTLANIDPPLALDVSLRKHIFLIPSKFLTTFIHLV